MTNHAPGSDAFSDHLTLAGRKGQGPLVETELEGCHMAALGMSWCIFVTMAFKHESDRISSVFLCSITSSLICYSLCF